MSKVKFAGNFNSALGRSQRFAGTELEPFLASHGIVNHDDPVLVKSTADSDYRFVAPSFPGKTFGTLADAVTYTTARAAEGRGYQVILMASDELLSDTITITWSTAIIGVYNPVGNGSMWGARLTLPAAQAKKIQIDAAYCKLVNLKIVGGGSSAATNVVVVGTIPTSPAPYFHMKNCWLTVGSSAAALNELNIRNAYECVFEDCRFGTLTVARPATAIDHVLYGQSATGGDTYKNCEFFMNSNANTDQFVTMLAEQIEPVIFDNCKFFNGVTGTPLLIGVVIADGGEALFHSCSMVGAAAMATDANGWVVPSGMGNTVALADEFNPGLAQTGAEPASVDT